MARYEFFKVGNKTVGYDITLEESIGRNLFAYLLTFALFAVIGGLLATIIPLVLFIMYFYTVKNQLWFNNAVSIAFSLYFIMDYHFGWLCYKLFSILISDVWYDRILVLNMGLLVTNVILLINNLIQKDRDFKNDILNNKNNVIGIAIGIIFLLSITENNIVSKYKEPVKTEEQIKIEKNQMY